MFWAPNSRIPKRCHSLIKQQSSSYQENKFPDRCRYSLSKRQQEFAIFCVFRVKSDKSIFLPKRRVPTQTRLQGDETVHGLVINTKLCTGCANSSRPQLDSYVGIVQSIGIIETFSEIGTAEEGHRDNSPRDTIPTDACPTGLETEVLDEADPLAHWVAWTKFIRSLSFIYL